MDFKIPRILSVLILIALLRQAASAQATQPADDAAKLYLQAAKLIDDNYVLKIWPPSASNSIFPEYPPFPDEWQQMEETDFAANAPARALAREARSIDHADWPPRQAANSGPSYLNGCRAIANELGDAALWQQFQANDAEAFETLHDLSHLSDLMENQPHKTLIRLLVGIGIDALMCERLDVITSNAVVTNDPRDAKDLQAGTAREFIAQLLQFKDAKIAVSEALQDEGTKANIVMKPALDRIIETEKRVDAERGMAAMSLACHLYRFDTGDWPASLDKLSTYLPVMPIDPWGDGKQTLGYALIKGGLPDGSDRPLVYSRCWSKDGLFFRNDEPEYGFYSGDGSQNSPRLRKQGGQFRDVANWTPGQRIHAVPTTQPLN